MIPIFHLNLPPFHMDCSISYETPNTFPPCFPTPWTAHCKETQVIYYSSHSLCKDHRKLLEAKQNIWWQSLGRTHAKTTQPWFSFSLFSCAAKLQLGPFSMDRHCSLVKNDMQCYQLLSCSISTQNTFLTHYWPQSLEKTDEDYIFYIPPFLLPQTIDSSKWIGKKQS